MTSESSLTERVMKFQEEIMQRGVIREGAGLNKVQPSQRAYQLTQNYLFLLVGAPIDLNRLKIFRRSINALAERDLTDHRASKRPEDLPLIERGYRDENKLFMQHFPEDEFPSLYESV